MAEYIEREALREAFIKHFDAVYDDGKLVFSDHICTAEDCEDILKLVAELPTAEVEPIKHAEWRICCDGWYPYCSNCGYEPPWVVHIDMRTPRCPYCGAKMIFKKEGVDNG
jgi:DNA-directed RNA polymerase subunit RPC12/RpoP